MIELSKIPFPDNFETWAKLFSKKIKVIEDKHNIEPLKIEIGRDFTFHQLILKKIENNISDTIQKEVLLAFQEK